MFGSFLAICKYLFVNTLTLTRKETEFLVSVYINLLGLRRPKFTPEDGNLSVLSTTNTFPGSSCTAKIKVSGTSIKVWFDGSLKFDRTDSTFDSGGVGFSGDTALFDNLKIGYDNNADDDIDDAGDDVVLDDNFSTKERTFTYDDAGNLIDDGTFVYVYDA